MNTFLLSWKYFWSRPVSVIINTLLYGLGVGLVIFLLIAQKQLSGTFTQSSQGIDLVVGAKGSPMQLILSSVHHVDYPTGNISLFEAEKITKNRFVKTAVPLALGDAYNGARIVGTTSKILELYNASIEKGNIWNKKFEVCLGSDVASSLGMKIGDTFHGQHGLVEGGYAHDDHHHFIVSGILKRTGTAIDQLILTSIEAIWEMHQEEQEGDHGDEHEEEQEGDHGDEHEEEHEEHEHQHRDEYKGEHEEHVEEKDENEEVRMSRLIPTVNLHSEDSTQEVTSILIAFRSPMGAMQLPRYINSQTNMQSASPAMEMARLLTIVGSGAEAVKGLAYIIWLVAFLSMSMTMYNALRERKYDLAVMRSLGASKTKLFLNIVIEGGMMSIVGTLMGVLVGHLLMVVVGNFLGNFHLDATTFYLEEMYVMIGSALLGMVVAIIPVWKLYSMDVSRVLSES